MTRSSSSSVPKRALPSSSSSSSILFHAKSGNANYAWLRLTSSSSSIPSLIPVSLSNLEHTVAEAIPISSNHYNGQPTPPIESGSLLNPTRSYEASIRASTKIPVPMASISSIRITPTIRWIQQHRMWQPTLSRSSVTTAPPVTNPKNPRHLCDTSCDVEVTSGGSGRTTATLTITPYSNIATMTGATNKSIMALAMEYRLSGGFNIFRGRQPWNPRTIHAQITTTTRQQHEQTQAQHWIRQIWEWRPSDSTSSIDRSHFRSMSLAKGIIASQYQWLILWPSGQSMRTIFDPPRHTYWDHRECMQNGGVTFTWMDPTNQKRWNPFNLDDEGGNATPFSSDGTWITDIRIPFVRLINDGNTTRNAKSLLWKNLFSSEIRVRRQFRF